MRNALRKKVVRQSALRAPLNHVLGTETSIRILRGLLQLAVPVGISQLARHINMDKAGVWRATRALEELGAVEALGLAKQQTVRPRKEYFFTKHLEHLFRAEQLRFEKLLDKLSDAARSLIPPANSLWIEGAVAMECDEPDEPLVVGILAASSQVGTLAETFRRHTTALQQEFSVVIETRPLTTADLAVMNRDELRVLDTIILLAGVPPLAFSPSARRGAAGQGATLHKQRDDQSLRFARAIAARLRKDPTLRRRAAEYLKRRLRTASPREANELEEWQRALDTYSLAQLRKLLTGSGEHATRLRQSSPFPPILSRTERAEILQCANEHEAE